MSQGSEEKKKERCWQGGESYRWQLFSEIGVRFDFLFQSLHLCFWSTIQSHGLSTQGGIE
jgi:hypothetical protein